MSVSLAWQPAQNLLAAHADNVTSDLATEPFAVGPGALLILVILGLVLLVAIGQVLTLVWQVIRAALPILVVLLVGLGVVVMVGAAALTNSGGAPERPTVTTSPPTPPPIARRSASGRRSSKTPPKTPSPSLTERSGIVIPIPR
jgi:hypothetical protein